MCVHGDVHRILVFVSILTIRLYDYKMCAMKFFWRDPGHSENRFLSNRVADDTYLHWQNINIEADEPSGNHKCPHYIVINHSPPDLGGFDFHQLAKNFLVHL